MPAKSLVPAGRVTNVGSMRSPAAQGLQGFLAAQGFFAAHGFAAFMAHGFLAAHGLAAFMAHGFLALAAQGFFAAHGFAACATVVAAGLACPELTSELVQDAAVKAIRQTTVLHNITGCFLRMTACIVPLL
jgi:hypothetical protein